jgi:hypothetical protein
MILRCRVGGLGCIFIMIWFCKVGGAGSFTRDSLGVGLIMAYVYCDFALQGRSFRVVYKGVLGLWLIMVYVYCDFVLQGRKFRVVSKGVLGLGLLMV